MAKVTNKTKGFNSISRDLVFDNVLSDRARFLYVYMACKPESWDFYQDKVAEELGYKKDTLRKYLDELIERGWIVEDEKRNQGKFGVLEYTIEIERKHGENLPIRKKTVSEKNRNGKNHEQRDIDNISSKQSLSDKEEIENNKRLSNDNPKVDEFFEDFWRRYHRKGVKSKALKMWNRLNDKNKKLALDAVDDYVLFCKRSNRSQADGSTFLNQEYYLEDWKQVPACYQDSESDVDEKTINFKRYMREKWPDLIYHRNPLTVEQGIEMIEKYGINQFEWLLSKLCERDVHQYYSIKQGIEKVFEETEANI
jgi:hypothetical protein